MNKQDYDKLTELGKKFGHDLTVWLDEYKQKNGIDDGMIFGILLDVICWGVVNNSAPGKIKENFEGAKKFIDSWMREH